MKVSPNEASKVSTVDLNTFGNQHQRRIEYCRKITQGHGVNATPAEAVTVRKNVIPMLPLRSTRSRGAPVVDWATMLSY